MYIKEIKLTDDTIKREHYYSNKCIMCEEYLKDICFECGLNTKLYSLHSLDGPAQVWYNNDGSIRNETYYIDGNFLTKEDFILKNNLKIFF